MRLLILDGYTDEPAGLGVPPYIGTYPRYAAGAALAADRRAEVIYRTVDQLRADPGLFVDLANASDLLIVICGVHTPANYINTTPATIAELAPLLGRIKTKKILGGPAATVFGSQREGGKGVDRREAGLVESIFDIVCSGDVEAVVFDVLKRGIADVEPSRTRTYAELRDWAVLGAKVVVQHPDFPKFTIAELETSRGCPRAISGGCSFCVEPRRYGIMKCRSPEDIIAEVEALYNLGVRNFRIGRQSCIFSYCAEGIGETERPKPNPAVMQRLFEGIRSVAPNLNVLHVDNADPAVIFEWPAESKEVAKTIVKYGTPGNIAAFGLESADPKVRVKNNLNCSAEECLEAVKILNEVGAGRGANGMPNFLPGINFVFGLDGEREETFELNFLFLKDLLDKGLLLRRINLRQVVPFTGTKVKGLKMMGCHKSLFHKYKEKIRKEIDAPMLKRVVPFGTLMKDVRTEMREGNTTFGRQIGTYPLLVGIPTKLPLNQFVDVKVMDYGMRSITALPYPVDINKAPLRLIEKVPGVSVRKAADIVIKRPFASLDELFSKVAIEDIGKVKGFIGL